MAPRDLVLAARRQRGAPAGQRSLFPDERADVADDDGRAAYSVVERAKVLARAMADATPPKLRVAHAQAFCAMVVRHFWAAVHGRRAPSLREPPCEEKSLRREAVTLAGALADGAALLSVEDAAYLIGSTYAAMLPQDVRSTHGVYYTPPLLVRRLLDAASAAGVDWSTSRVLDPACGGGAFLSPVAARMVASLKGSDRRMIIRSVASRLKGIEIDPFAAWMSQVFLEVTLHDLLGDAQGIGEPITVADALTCDEEAAFDLVVGNPPYGRVTLDKEQRERFQRSLFGHANLYGVFLDLAVRKALSGGLVAFVTPTSFLSGEYFKRLRGMLGAEAGPVSLDFVDERSGVFDDVLQETILAVYRRGEKKKRPAVQFVDISGAKLTVSSAGEVPLPLNPEDPWVLPRSPGSLELVRRLGTMSARLRDWGYGVSTGPLVWNRYKGQLRMRHDTGTVPLIWAESVSADGTFSFRAARRNHAPYFATESDEWLLVKQACVLLQRTTAKEQARRLIAAELPADFLDEHGAVTVENHLNMVVPVTTSPAVDTATVTAFLNTNAADRVFRCINGSVAVSAYELESMPLPSASAMSGLARLVQAHASRIETERFCDRLYGAP